MSSDILALMIPVIAVACVMGVGVVKLILQHQERILKMKLEQQERLRRCEQEEMEMTMGINPLVNAHLEAILERLNSLEAKLAPMDPAVPSQPAAPRTMNSIPKTDESKHRRDENLA